MRNAAIILFSLYIFLSPAFAEQPGRPLKLCLAERELLPVSSARFEAPGQYLARLAIERQGGKASFVAVPWRRCTEGVRTGLYDGAIGVVPTASFNSYMRYPMAGKEADSAKSLGNIVFVAMRPAGGAADWDGERFTHVAHPVLFNAAARAIFDKLAELNVPRDSDTPQEAQMMTRLLSGRADIAIGREDAVTALLDTQAFRGRIEVLPRPFVSTPTYLAFRDSVAAANPDFAEAVWREVDRIRRAPDWEETARRLMAPASATPE